MGSADVCTDPDCHAAKVDAHTERVRQLAEEAGKKIIDGADAQKIVPYAGAWRLAGYVRLDERCDSAPAREVTDDDAADLEADREDHDDMYDSDPDAPDYEAPRTIRPRYRELLDPQTETEVVTIVDPHSGVPFEAIPTKAIAQALQAKGIEDWRVQNSRSSADTRAENKEKRHKQRVEVAFRNRLIDDIRAALQRGEPANDDAGSVRHLHTVILAASLFDRSPPKTKRQLCSVFGWEVPGYGYLDIDVARKHFDALDHQQIAEALILLIVLPAIEIDDYHNPSPVELVDIAESLGIGTKAIRREVANELKPKAKPVKDKAPGKPKARNPKAGAADTTATPTASVPIAVGDRVRVKEDSRGPGGKRLKVCGREGTVATVDLTRVAVNFDDGSVHANLQHEQLDVLQATADSAPTENVEAAVWTVGQRVQVKNDAKGLNGRPLPYRRRTGSIIDVMNLSAKVEWDDGKKPVWVLMGDLADAPPAAGTVAEPERASDQDADKATTSNEVDA